jgi:hypothetical protein
MNPYFSDARPAPGRLSPAWAEQTAAWGRTGEVPPEPPGGYPAMNPPPWVTDPQKPSRVIVWVLAAVGVFVVLCLGGIGLAVAGGDDPEPKPSDTVVTTEPTTPPTVRPTTPSTTEPTTVPPPAGAKKAAPAKVTYAKLTSREWKKIAKNPDAYAGKTYVVYGMITQFDAATGEDNFRAQVDGVRRSSGWDYPTNTIVTAPGTGIQDLVEDDKFKAEVTVIGAFEYETTLGGETTVPHLLASKVTRL